MDSVESGFPTSLPGLATSSDVARPELDTCELEILAFEAQWWKYAGAKEQAIHELFGMTSTRYYQVLNSLLDKPAALAADPMLVKRLRRLRSTRQLSRQAGRVGAGEY